MDAFTTIDRDDFDADGTAATCADAAPVVHHRVARGQALFHEGTPAHSLYQVYAGDFKLVRTEVDGYEQVLDFAGSPDLLGLDALSTGHHGCAAVALEDATVLVYPFAELDGLRHAHPALGAQLRAAWGRQFERLSELAWLMAAVGTDRRTARFLLLISRRMAERGQSPRRLRLRMRRRDIASYLGLAHESVTRSLGAMADAGLLRVDLRDVEIVDPAALERFARTTRGGHEGAGALAPPVATQALAAATLARAMRPS